MVHMEAIVDPNWKPTFEAPALHWLGNQRMNFLARYDRWITCKCKCGRAWNFASGIKEPLIDDSNKRESPPCAVDEEPPSGFRDPLKLKAKKIAAMADAFREENREEWFRPDVR